MRMRIAKVLVVCAACGSSPAEGETSGSPSSTTMPAESSGPASSEAGSGSSTGPVTIDPSAATTSSSGDDNGEAPKLDVGGVASESGESGNVDECPCENVDDGIYVLHSTTPASVWFYDPPANDFTQVGMLGCPAPLGATANSMAIDREGYAWINYYQLGLDNQGFIYRASLEDLGSCFDQGYTSDGDWFLLGMGYSVDVPDGSCDTLYLYKSDQYINNPNFVGGSELARWDEAASQLDVIGDADYPVAELSGTGDARLFGFATLEGGDTVLVELDKQDGSELASTPLVGLEITNAFAFAFWGGDVYFFTETFSGSGSSKVTRLDYDGTDGGGLDVVNADTGLHITGAGVSTCASFTPPN